MFSFIQNDFKSRVYSRINISKYIPALKEGEADPLVGILFHIWGESTNGMVS
jgi:hypothetical protein